MADTELNPDGPAGTGFSEEDLERLSTQLREHCIAQPRSYYRFGESLLPDVWFDARVVWEIKAADLSISPVHQAARGLVDPVKGISIRQVAGGGGGRGSSRKRWRQGRTGREP